MATTNKLQKSSDGSTIAGLTDSQLLDNGTNVGIGTTSPGRLLHIYRSSSSTDSLLRLEDASSGNATLQLRVSNTTSWFMGIDNSDADKLKIGTSEGFASSVAMTVQGDGNVGIGISSQPDSTLMVARQAGTSGHRTAQIAMQVESGTGGVHSGLVVATTTSTASTWTPGTGSQLFGAAIEVSSRRSATSEALVMGLNVQARGLSGATGGGTEITGIEVDTTLEVNDAGLRAGILVAAAPASAATNYPATGADFAYGIGAKEGGAPFKRGFYVFDASGAATIWPIRSDGTIFEAIPAAAETVANGVVLDPTNLTITGNAFQSAKFRVKGTGAVVIGSNADPLGTLDVAASSGDTEIIWYRSSGSMGRLRALSGSVDLGSYSNHPVRILTNSAQVVHVDVSGNVGIGSTAFGTNAAKVLSIANGTEPTTSPADMVQVYSVDISPGNASIGIRTETGVATESVTSDRTLQIRINGTTYKLLLKS